MDYNYKTMEEIALLHSEDDLMFALELMDMDFEETESKEGLAKMLVAAQKEHLHEIFYMSSYEDLQAFEIMSKNKGSFITGDILSMYKGLFPESLFDLPQDLCLVTPMKLVGEESQRNINYELFVSQEFLELFKEYLTEDQKALCFALDEMARIIRGCLYYYGAVEMEELYSIVSKKYKELNKNLFKTVLGYKHVLYYVYESEMLGNNEYIKDEMFESYYELSEVRHWKSTVREYKDFKREELFAAGDELFIENRESYDKIVKYFKPFYEPLEEDLEGFEDLSEEVQYDFFMQNTLELLQRSLDHNAVAALFLESFRFKTNEQSNKGLFMLQKHVNNLSRWENRGYSADEMILRVKDTNVIPMKAYRKK